MYEILHLAGQLGDVGLCSWVDKLHPLRRCVCIP